MSIGIIKEVEVELDRMMVCSSGYHCEILVSEKYHKGIMSLILEEVGGTNDKYGITLPSGGRVRIIDPTGKPRVWYDMCYGGLEMTTLLLSCDVISEGESILYLISRMRTKESFNTRTVII